MVMGLGYVVTRDLASFLKNEPKDQAGNPNPIALSASEVGVRRAYGGGISSTGMYMRDFLYLGFNEDESHRKVFDAVQIVIPGTHRLLANVEFSDPNTYSRQDVWHDWLSYSYPPLTFAVTTDPISGIRDGILKRPPTDPMELHRLLEQVIDNRRPFNKRSVTNRHRQIGQRDVAVPFAR